MKYGEEVVYALLDLLNEAQVPYIMVGSFSSNALWRGQGDQGCRFRGSFRGGRQVGSPGEVAKRVRVRSAGELRDHHRPHAANSSNPFEIELFDLSDEPFDQSRFTRRLRTSLEDHTVWLPTAEDVVVQKLRWATLGKREKDLLDVISILRVRSGMLDWDYYRAVVLGIEDWRGFAKGQRPGAGLSLRAHTEAAQLRPAHCEDFARGGGVN